jgi:hypothetical protein
MVYSKEFSLPNGPPPSYDSSTSHPGSRSTSMSTTSHSRSISSFNNTSFLGPRGTVLPDPSAPYFQFDYSHPDPSFRLTPPEDAILLAKGINPYTNIPFAKEVKMKAKGINPQIVAELEMRKFGIHPRDQDAGRQLREAKADKKTGFFGKFLLKAGRRP